MTKKLKIRFIIFTMSAVTCLLVFIVFSINALNFMMLERQSDMVLQKIVDSNGKFQMMDFDRPPPFSPPLDMDRMRSSRFFIAIFDENDNIIDINIDEIFSVDKTTAESIAKKVIEKNQIKGRISQYKYFIKEVKSNKIVFFVDTKEQISSFYMVLLLSSVIALLCFLILLIIVIFLSGKVIRPVIAGIEKQKQFITNAGHEMKTPLAIIKSNNDTMKLIHGENKYNVHIANQVNRLNSLMSNLLTLAKLDEEVKMIKEEVNISRILSENIKVYVEQASQKGIVFSTNIENDVIIKTNKDSFLQLITILLDNAVKYTLDNGFINFNLVKDGKYVKIIEENSCDTTLEENPERLFERFLRADSSRARTEQTSGYGIGLSAARAICENFDGTIKAYYPTNDTIRFEIQLIVNN